MIIPRGKYQNLCFFKYFLLQFVDQINENVLRLFSSEESITVFGNLIGGHMTLLS